MMQPANPVRAQPSHPADRVAAAARSVPGVVDLHPGRFGEVGTYLPGRQVPGVRLDDDDGTAEVHITIAYGVSVPEVAAAVRAAVGTELPGATVNVVIGGVVGGGAGDTVGGVVGTERRGRDVDR